MANQLPGSQFRLAKKPIAKTGTTPQRSLDTFRNRRRIVVGCKKLWAECCGIMCQESELADLERDGLTIPQAEASVVFLGHARADQQTGIEF